MLKKAALVSTYNGLQCYLGCHTISSSTSPLALPPQRARPQHGAHDRTAQRSYATVKSRNGPDFRDNMNWPCRHSTSHPPTPYEIFDLEKGAVYTKHKFYELVKIYHPDRSNHEGSLCDSLSRMERLERYRLVVLAHEILSDPDKRRAYDSHGIGWGQNSRSPSRHTRGYSSTTHADGKAYGFGGGNDESPFSNATWEDWERWYRRSDPANHQSYRGTYVNPNAFASFVILLAVISGVAQATRAGQYSHRIEEKALAFTEETSRFLSSRADSYAENNINTSDGRIRHFLQRRDPTRYGLKDEEEQAYRRYFAGHGHMDPSPPPPPPPSSRPRPKEKIDQPG